MASVAELRAIALLDGKQFEAEIKKIGNSTTRTADGFGKLQGMIAGAFSIGAIVSFGKHVLAAADDLQTAASTFGLSTESMIVMKGVMAESGIGADRFLKIFGKLNTSLSEAKSGVKTYTNALSLMNINVAEIAGLGVDQVIELMAKRYGEAGDKAQYLYGVSKIFGERIGPGLIEVFQRINTKGLDGYRESAHAAAAGIDAMAEASNRLETVGHNLLIWLASVANLVGRTAEGFAETTKELLGLERAADQATGKKPDDVLLVMPTGDPVYKKKETLLERLQRKQHPKREPTEDERNAASKQETRAIQDRAKEEARYAKLLNQQMIARLTLLEKIEYYESLISKTRQKVKMGYADLSAPGDIIEYEMKLDELRGQRDAATRAANQDRIKNEEQATQKRERLLAREAEILSDTEQSRAEIESGKGLGASARPVDSLLAMGGLVGNMVNAPQLQAAERAAKATEAMNELQANTNRKLDDVRKEIQELGRE